MWWADIVVFAILVCVVVMICSKIYMLLPKEVQIWIQHGWQKLKRFKTS